jgi:hypothetical protein
MLLLKRRILSKTLVKKYFIMLPETPKSGRKPDREKMIAAIKKYNPFYRFVNFSAHTDEQVRMVYLCIVGLRKP